MKQLQTKHNENRLVTSDPAEMINKYTCKPIIKTSVEYVKNEDTGEDERVERSTFLLDKGVFIDNNTLESIRFWIEEGSITEVEVSDQKRMAGAFKSSRLYPYKASVKVGAKEKKETFLLYANSLSNATEIVTDYIELNYVGPFFITDVRQLDYCPILIDRFKVMEKDAEEPIVAYIKEDEIFDSEDEETEDTEETETDEKKDTLGLKFYQIGAHIDIINEDKPVHNYNENFIVQTFSASRANRMIEMYLRDLQKKNNEKVLEMNPNAVIERNEIFSSIEESKILSIGQFIPKYFSIAYQ